MGKIIKYHDNGGDVIRKIEVDLTNIAEPTEYLENIAKNEVVPEIWTGC